MSLVFILVWIFPLNDTITEAERLFAESKFEQSYKIYSNTYKNCIEKENRQCQVDIIRRMLLFISIVDSDEEYYQKYLKQLESLSHNSLDSAWFAYSTIRMKMHYNYQRKEFKNIKGYDWKSLIYQVDQTKDNELLIRTYSLMATYQKYTEGNLNAAEKSYLTALKLIEQAPPELHTFFLTTYSNLGNCYQQQGFFDKAIDFYKKALLVEAPSNNIRNRTKIHNWLVECFDATGNIDSAYYYLRVHYDELLTSETTQHNIAIAELEEKLQNESLIQENKIARQNISTLTIILVIVLVASATIYSYIKRINRLTEITLKQEIEQTQQVAEIKAINARLDGEEQERRRVATVIHDEISSHLTAAALNLAASSNTKDQSLINARNLIHEVSERSRSLSHSLFPPILIKLGLVDAIDHLARTYSSPSIQFKVVSHISHFVLQEDIKSKLYHIISELVQNIAKHSGATIGHISFKKDKEQIIIEVVDNGKGFRTPKENYGIGLHTISSRLKNIHALLDIKTSNDGTTVSMYIPSFHLIK